jgi:hypothetical protein
MSGLGDPWGAETSPSGTVGAYANTLELLAPGTIQNTVQQPGESPLDAFFRTAISLAQTSAQIALIRQQQQRASVGQLPNYFPPATSGVMNEDTQKMLLIGGIVLVGVLVLPKLMK